MPGAEGGFSEVPQHENPVAQSPTEGNLAWQALEHNEGLPSPPGPSSDRTTSGPGEFLPGTTRTSYEAMKETGDDRVKSYQDQEVFHDRIKRLLIKQGLIESFKN